jgi:tyrosine-protein phosphatase SIW14
MKPLSIIVLAFALGCQWQLLAQTAAPGALPPAVHVRNFGQVSSQIYRGGEPTQVGLQELAAMGVKVDIDLREPGSQTELEKQTAERLGMKYLNIPFKPFSAPTDADVQNVLSLLINGGTEPIFLHCRRGKDRTGTVIACYRVQHDGWDNQRALAEAKSYGMSSTERGMRSYVLKFQPMTLAGALKP